MIPLKKIRFYNQGVDMYTHWSVEEQLAKRQLSYLGNRCVYTLISEGTPWKFSGPSSDHWLLHICSIPSDYFRNGQMTVVIFTRIWQRSLVDKNSGFYLCKLTLVETTVYFWPWKNHIYRIDCWSFVHHYLRRRVFPHKPRSSPCSAWNSSFRI